MLSYHPNFFSLFLSVGNIFKFKSKSFQKESLNHSNFFVPYLKGDDDHILQIDYQNINERLEVYNDTLKVDIRNSYFYDIINQGSNGGAVYYNTTRGTLNIENSIFRNCQASEYGGVLFMLSSQTSECSLSFVCGINYKTSSAGQFDYIYLKNSSIINYIQSSMVITTSTNESAYYTMYHRYYNMTYSNINISGNYCQEKSVIYDFPNNRLNMEYSSIRNNTAFGSNCLLLQIVGSRKYIQYCDIIENRQYSSLSGIFETIGVVTISNSNIIDNDIGSGYIFWVVLGSVICNNCYVPSDQREIHGYAEFNNCDETINLTLQKSICTIQSKQISHETSILLAKRLFSQAKYHFMMR